ncbi:hypothetical protein [Lysobacter auxotrophicus]|uniref:7-cyano-7-deazaguanine synthase n=1 Tax=Lysobacter auxotrophicus TaxID=2992573 RepID=A0ABM8D9J4_9GAMM|nr:hypothetical protein [Lysobacter auxotrophicus]BDU15204.1 7-cyano-7-deazaguanine synthase [Lysobacter auxotrophicus]
MSTPRVQGYDDTTVNLLWTGGWDSTYRLLQLLLRHRVRVAPWYLEDPTRPSTQIEIATMARITSALHQRFPHTRELLQPLRRAAVTDIDVDDDIADALREIRRTMFIGSQYAWLPAFCRRESLDGMELGVHVDDKVQAVLRDCSEEFDHPAGFRSIRVDPARAGTAERVLFGRFTFPLFRVDKRDIERDALDAGWGELMEMTWFCHKPVRGRPCGFCPPCVYTIEEGLARRVPQSRRMLSFFYRSVALPLKTSLRQMRASRQGRRSSPESRARNG